MLENYMGVESRRVETESRMGRPPPKGVLASQLPWWVPGAYSHQGDWQLVRTYIEHISEFSLLWGKTAGVFIHQLLSGSVATSK